MSLTVEMLSAIAALRLKGRFDLVPGHDGVVVRRPGYPDLLLTDDAAISYYRARQEAENAP